MSRHSRSAVALRDVTEADIDTFFEQQQDPVASHMAAFTTKDPADRESFTVRWEKLLSDETITKKTILVDENVAGHVVSFERFGKPEITYWLGREFWGKRCRHRSAVRVPRARGHPPSVCPRRERQYRFRWCAGEMWLHDYRP